MCYDIKTSKQTQLKKALREGYEEVARHVLDELMKIAPNEYYHVSGFTHPKMIIYTNENPNKPVIGQWGLVAPWVKDNEQKLQAWNNTLNARSESMFEKPSYKTSAKSKRGLLYVDGFYEHHHKNGKTFPYFIHRKDNEPMAMGILYNDWVDKTTGEITNTFSIVTTKGNNLMTDIHNNPMATEPRMPLILPDELAEEWLIPIEDELDKKKLNELILPFADDELEAHTVAKLRGKQAVGNVAEVTKEVHYNELNEQDSLF